ncbi:MAG: hypothetical protein AAB309_03315 [Deltaproteobacteria bacterium]
MGQIELIKTFEILARNHKKKVFFLREIASLLSLSRPATAMLLIRAEKKGIVFRVKNLWVNFLNSPSLLEVAIALYSPSYLSLESALFHHQCLSQSPKGGITLVTSGRPFKIKTPLGNIRYFHVKEKLFFGFNIHRIAYPEKAWLDLVYLRGLKGRSKILSEEIDLDGFNQKRLFRFATCFPSWVSNLSKKVISSL